MWGFQTLFSTSSYVKDKRKIHSYVTLLIKLHSVSVFKGAQAVFVNLNL